MAVLEVNPFAPGEVFDWMWGANGGTHASAQWQTNGNDLYAAPGARVVAPITGTIVRVGPRRRPHRNGTCRGRTSPGHPGPPWVVASGSRGGKRSTPTTPLVTRSRRS